MSEHHSLAPPPLSQGQKHSYSWVVFQGLIDLTKARTLAAVDLPMTRVSRSSR